MLMPRPRKARARRRGERYRSRGLTLGTKGAPITRTGSGAAVSIGPLSATCRSGGGPTTGSSSASMPATMAQHSVTVPSRTMFRFSSAIRMGRKRPTRALCSGGPDRRRMSAKCGQADTNLTDEPQKVIFPYDYPSQLASNFNDAGFQCTLLGLRPENHWDG